MEERHEREQYFFTRETRAALVEFASAYERPCCLCAPSLGRAIAEAGRDVAVLDVDERFADLPGFRRFDLHRPAWLGEEFDLILCDPPFFTVSLSRLFAAIRTLARNDFRQPLLLTYLDRRRHNVVGTFAKFGLEPVDAFPDYVTVKACAKNDIRFFGNLGDAGHARLAALLPSD
jgi:hypothetical protein